MKSQHHTPPSLSEATLKAYENILQKQIENLCVAESTGDVRRMREVCHKIKGSAALFGKRELGEACHEMEGLDDLAQARSVFGSILKCLSS